MTKLVTKRPLAATRHMVHFHRVALLLLSALAVLPLAPSHAQAPTTERITLIVEVVTRDYTPVIPCGRVGAQPRDVTARVLTVEEGAFPGDTVLLSWPLCEFSRLGPGDQFRIRIRRRVGRPTSPSTRYLVRWEQAVPGGATTPRVVQSARGS